MTDIKNLRKIIRDARDTLRLAKQPRRHAQIEKDPRLERKILRVQGNIRSIKVQVKRLHA